MIENKPYRIEKKNFYLNLAIEAIQYYKEKSIEAGSLDWTRAQLMLSDIRDGQLKLIETKSINQYNIQYSLILKRVNTSALQGLN